MELSSKIGFLRRPLPGLIFVAAHKSKTIIAKQRTAYGHERSDPLVPISRDAVAKKARARAIWKRRRLSIEA